MMLIELLFRWVGVRTYGWMWTGSSKDLVTWRKHGLAFKDYPNEWAKAGSVSVPPPPPALVFSNSHLIVATL